MRSIGKKNINLVMKRTRQEVEKQRRTGVMLSEIDYKAVTENTIEALMKELTITPTEEKTNELCDHNWQPEEDNEGWHVRGLGETLEKDLVCSKCGKRAREVWIFSCILDENDKEV